MPRRNRSPGRPKNLQKRAAILDTAKRLFLQAGFDGVSMDQIAAESRVSKLTVYNHFQDKEGLFVTAIKEHCQEQLPDKLFVSVNGAPLEQALRDIGRSLHDLLTSEDSVALHRMMIGDPRNAERLGTLFWTAGAARVIAGLETFLGAAVSRGELDIDDTREAAGQFLALLKSEMLLRMLCGPIGCLHEGDADAHVDSVVTLFLRAYRPCTAQRGGAVSSYASR